MKQVANSYSAKINYGQIAATGEASRAWVRALRMPNWVWLMMIFLAAAALALTTIARERTQLQGARTSHARTEQRLTQAQAETEKLRAKVKSARNDPRVSENAAQDRLNYVRPNEIVVPIR
ncbi:MAG TPA: septum formation initiator family protein [Blastocatellia bacterium]|nr:septum formation initiator family protein [Blastocatellia bacterium]